MPRHTPSQPSRPAASPETSTTVAIRLRPLNDREKEGKQNRIWRCVPTHNSVTQVSVASLEFAAFFMFVEQEVCCFISPISLAPGVNDVGCSSCFCGRSEQREHNSLFHCCFLFTNGEILQISISLREPSHCQCCCLAAPNCRRSYPPKGHTAARAPYPIPGNHLGDLLPFIYGVDHVRLCHLYATQQTTMLL